MRKAALTLVLASFLASSLNISVLKASEIILPAPGTMVMLSSAFNLPILKGIKVHPEDPFKFEFILDQGSDNTSLPGGISQRDVSLSLLPNELELNTKAPEEAKQTHRSGKIADQQLKMESTKLIKYFLAALTTPEKDLWVNLSPYEKDRIVPDSFGQTEMGRDLLAQDYLLKQVTASLVYPEGEVGKEFWIRIYEKAHSQPGGISQRDVSSSLLPNNLGLNTKASQGNTQPMMINTFNKVWIVPNKAVVYENVDEGTAYVVESSLKVMTEQDYLAIEKSMKTMSFPSASIGNPEMSKPGPPIKALEGDKNTSQIIRDLIIPQLTKEINEGKNFAQLRQVYNALILATWYKNKIKDSILNQVYADKNKVAGISIDNPQEKQNIYERYLEAFKKGAYNYIKEEQDPVSRKMLPRKYFSGGVNVFGISKQLDTTGQFDTSSSNPNLAMISVLLSQDEARHHSNQAMTNVEERIRKAATIIDQEIKVHGLKNFRLLERLSSQYGEEMNVYEFNGFKIIKKEFWLEDVRVIQELSQAKKSAIVPLFFTNEFPKSYFELDLRDFGYVSFFDTSTKWVTADTLKRIRDLYKATFRSDNHIWFQHGHLHMKNILVKFSEDGGIDDFKFIDFKVLEKVNVDTNPLLMAIRDGKKLNSIRQDFVDGVSLEWMELDGFDFSSLNFTAQAFIGSSLVKAIFHKSRLDSVSFELADLTGADFSDASIQDESTSFLYANMKDVDVAGASFDFPELLAYSLNLDKKIGDSARLAKYDQAMKGGIDFNSDKMNLESKVDSRLRGNDKGHEGIQFHMDPAQLKQLQDSPGFAPIIIDIQPMMDLSKFLGVKARH